MSSFLLPLAEGKLPLLPRRLLQRNRLRLLLLMLQRNRVQETLFLMLTLLRKPPPLLRIRPLLTLRPLLSKLLHLPRMRPLTMPRPTPR